MFIGEKVVWCSFKVFYCDNKESEMLYVVLNIIAC